MKRYATWLISAHAILLLLASTRLTLVESPLAPGTWTWNYARFAFTNGWGQPFRSDYPVSVIFAYVAAYAIGIAGYASSRRSLAPGLWVVGLGLSALGLVSFVIEGGHSLFTYNLSVIMAVPLLSLPLAVISLASRFHSRQLAPVA
jgi:hypothetical protein